MNTRLVLILAMAMCCSAIGCSAYRRTSSYPEPPATSYRVTHLTVTGIGDPERVQAAVVTPDFFKTTKALPLFGRLFLAEDYRGPARYVVLSHRFWQRKFGGNPNAIGMRVEVDGKTWTIIGMMPESFDLPPGAQLWMPQETLAP